MSVTVLGLVLAGCGSATARSGASTSTTGVPRATKARAVAPPGPGGAARSCSETVANTLRRVAMRIYDQAAGGRNVSSSAKRLARSRALATAVGRGDPAATRAALRPLLKSQIHRIVVTRGSRVLADIGTSSSLAPVSGVIRDAGGATVGRYTMAVSNDAAISGITHAVTGSQVIMRAGAHQVASTVRAFTGTLPDAGTVRVGGVSYTVSSFQGTAFPRGSLRVWLLSPAPDRAICGATASETIVNTIGAVGQRLYRTESSGPAPARALRHVARDRRFVRAVAARDPAGLRTEIVRFFHDRTLHIVRVRAVTADGRLVNDVGGPYVLAPASMTLRANGRTIGRFTLAIQDDAGYIKLMHRFTGAEVLLRTPAGEVPGSTLSPGPSTLPDRGSLTYGGRSYHVFSFAAEAFPSDPLRISLLLPSAGG